eukprot:g10311.t1
MIIRENARLFFLSALSSNAKCEDMIRASDFAFRPARKTDIDSIRHCNLETLPENYSSDFYDNHIRDWPELALVAEHSDRRHNEGQPPKVVGYVLGKMEGSKEDLVETHNQLNTAIPGWSTRPPRDRLVSSPDGGGGGLSGPRTGHVTSLAVLPGYRRCGAAKQLMDMLHDRMNYHYKATKVSLHVRKSNRGAIRLYEELLGYKVAGVASAYYSDGEDAFVMEAELPAVDAQPAAGVTGAPAAAPQNSANITRNSNSKGFVTAAAAAAGGGGGGANGNNRRHGGAGLVSAAATAPHGGRYFPPARNNVGFVTAAAAAAATVASARSATTGAAETAAGAAPPLVLQAVVSTPGRAGGSGGGGSGGSGGGVGGRKGSKGMYARFLGGGGGRRDGS